MAAAAMPSKNASEEQRIGLRNETHNMRTCLQEMSERGDSTNSSARTCHHTNLIVHGGT